MICIVLQLILLFFLVLMVNLTVLDREVFGLMPTAGKAALFYAII